MLGAKFRPPPKPWIMIFVGWFLLNVEFRRELKSRTSRSCGFCCVFLKIATNMRYVCICAIWMQLFADATHIRYVNIDDSESIGRYYRCRRKVSLERRLLSIENKMIVILKLRVTLTISSSQMFAFRNTWKLGNVSIHLSAKYKSSRSILRFRARDLYFNRNFYSMSY